MADAGILAWDQKYVHDFWRPVVGIREHDKSTGPAATQADNNISNNCDTSWLPLGAPNSNRIVKNFTPPFPHIHQDMPRSGLLRSTLRGSFTELAPEIERAMMCLKT